MRQFITWQFWAAIVALLVMTGGLWLVFRDDGAAAEQTAAPGSAADSEYPVPETGRQIDLIALVYAAQADPGFQIVGGRTTATMVINIDGVRTMTIVAGTPGENRCAALDRLASCAVAADLLGESVLWFSIIPMGPRNTVELPAVRDFQDGQRLRLANDWSVKRADRVKRICDTDTGSLTEFIATFGDAASSTFDLDDQRITAVTCPAA